MDKIILYVVFFIVIILMVLIGLKMIKIKNGIPDEKLNLNKQHIQQILTLMEASDTDYEFTELTCFGCSSFISSYDENELESYGNIEK